MTLQNLIEMAAGDLFLINNQTKINLTYDSRFVTFGIWYEDNILNYKDCPIEFFFWESTNEIHVCLLSLDTKVGDFV